jgi:TrmH family RNA methyltransferase
MISEALAVLSVLKHLSKRGDVAIDVGDLGGVNPPMQQHPDEKTDQKAGDKQQRRHQNRIVHRRFTFGPYGVTRHLALLGAMLHKITSPANPLVKTLKSLNAKKGRNEHGLFLAEGARLAAEAADLGVWPRIMIFAPTALERPASAKLIKRAEAAGVQCVETKEAVLSGLARRDNPQTIIGAYPIFDTALSRLSASKPALWVALERVRDPGNLGTVLRTADAAGAAGVILIGETCDPFSVEAVRASMGAIFSTPFAQAGLPEFSAWTRKNRMRVVGASLRGTMRHDEPPAEGAIVLMMGNEQSGLTEEGEAACDDLVKIPMAGKADSLNLAASTAVILYDFWRRRGYAKP